MRTLCTVLLLVLVEVTFEQVPELPPSPCPDVFTYETATAERGRWYGKVKLNTNTKHNFLNLIIGLDKRANILGNWLGNVSTIDNKEFIIYNRNVDQGFSEVRFFIQYSRLEATPPKVVAITFNGKDICKTSVGPLSTSGEFANNHQMECGKVKQNPVPLVLNGNPTLEGQWPWQIALYQAKNVNNNFMCGGTLLTRLHVITAAHCVTREGSTRVVYPNLFTIYLGKHNLRTSVRGVVIRFVEDIIVHPEYTKTNARDLAILLMKEPVTFSNWIQPACLWPGNQVDLSTVIGQEGYVVGWGVDVDGQLSEELSSVKMPVVDQETCLRSSYEFFGLYTSTYTYCAGFLNGTTVCRGDSGGGMVFRINNSWYLRGLVSLSKKAALEAKLPCETQHYVIFTDLAKFLPWINDHISENTSIYSMFSEAK